MKQHFAASLFLFSWALIQCLGQDLPIKAVNLGGWLVIEGWMTPSLFDAIPNKDLLDGTQVHLKSVRLNKYLCAENGGGSALVANRAVPRSWETFRLWRINETTFNFRVLNKDFIGLSTQGLGNKVSANAAESGTAESFRIVRNGDNPLRVRIQASNDLYLQNGLNAVRIPVGWWIIYDPVPPKPFVGVLSLDNAFEWAFNYNMKVILDLHAVPGSQNGNHHSGTRDGFLEWGDSRIPETVSVIDFLAARYADHPSLIAIELMNEPLAPGVTLDSLRKYYKAGYDAVRVYTSTAYVILSNRLGEANHTELLPFATGLNYSVIDVHYYNRYSDYFRTLNGEWTADLYINSASMQDYQRFAKAQLDVYGKATFGWAYWSYKCEQKHWSFRWMIENGYMKL
ncbi:UNVERIFIED_CONTAM: Glucan 1,3-beta-glucosidase [Sesamum radiatum]|uniref:Glucan 1,3-beta-glucosidase n=1 Tax=Sesamum radiatum TaxID=300843 RepID=A0AAW2M160_SESRA